MTRILVVEDEPGIALGLEDDLRLEGWDVEVAPDGVVGAKRAREQQFDLILLDVMLPGKDGFDVLHALKGEPATARLPVLILSVKDREEDVVKALSLGATGQGPVADMFWGDRCGKVVDLDGYSWMVGTHKAEPTVKEMNKMMKEQMRPQPAKTETAA